MPELNSLSLLSDANLEAYYRFNTGALTTDSSGDGETLTNNNTVGETASGQFGYAADFGTSNTNKYFKRSSNYGINGGGSYSFSLWFRTRATIGSGTWRFLEFVTTLTTNRYLGISLEYNGGTRRLRLDASGSSAYYNITPDNSLWYHLVGVRDSGGTATLYLNGVSVASASNGSSTYAQNYLTLGADESGNSPASIYLDDVAVFSRSLTAQEVSSIYQASSSFFMMF